MRKLLVGLITALLLAVVPLGGSAASGMIHNHYYYYPQHQYQLTKWCGDITLLYDFSDNVGGMGFAQVEFGGYHVKIAVKILGDAPDDRVYRLYVWDDSGFHCPVLVNLKDVLCCTMEFNDNGTYHALIKNHKTGQVLINYNGNCQVYDRLTFWTSCGGLYYITSGKWLTCVKMNHVALYDENSGQWLAAGWVYDENKSHYDADDYPPGGRIWITHNGNNNFQDYSWLVQDLT
jgi:hypothetical protein